MKRQNLMRLWLWAGAVTAVVFAIMYFAVGEGPLMTPRQALVALCLPLALFMGVHLAIMRHDVWEIAGASLWPRLLRAYGKVVWWLIAFGTLFIFVALAWKLFGTMRP